jgi:hypothetical protein
VQVTENAGASGATIDPVDFVEAERILSVAA